MAKKKVRATKVEVLPPDAPPKGGTDLSGNTKLDFTLNKNDVVDYFVTLEEEDVENQIKEAYARRKELQSKIRNLVEEFTTAVETKALKENKKLLSAAQRTLKKLSDLGFSGGGLSYRKDVHVAVRSTPITTIRYNNTPPGSGIRYYPRHKGALGKKVPEECIPTDERYDLFRNANHQHQWTWDGYCEGDLDKPKPFTTRYFLQLDGGLSSKHQTLEWDDRIKKLASERLEALNEVCELERKIYRLFAVYDDLPQMKKRIKRQIVGRVLKSTDDGKTLLRALKGLKNADVTKLLPG